MTTKEFVLGSLNQGRVTVGHKFSAFKQNTIFLSGICIADNYLDAPFFDKSRSALLKSIGGLSLRILNISALSNNHKIAELEMTENSKGKYCQIVDILFSSKSEIYSPQEPALMTLTGLTGLRSNDFVSIGYLSVLKPLGDGEYEMMHDYPIDRVQGPRYEVGHE